jgi:secreted trypsin-like serine protease/enterochelin esterase-like enzyme
MSLRRRGAAASLELLLALSLLAGLLIAPFAQPQAQAVVFGEEVPEASTTAPWVASIWYTKNINEKAQFICTGSLIRADIIITAAHCTFDKGFYWVKLGADTLDSDEPLLEVSGTWRDTRYSKKTITNDLGILKLTRPVTDVRPIAIPTQSQLSKVAKLTKFKMYGWGLDQNKEVAKFLRTANLDLQDAAAKRAYGKNFKPEIMLASGRYIRAEGLYAGGCNGDSGGPLIGIVDRKPTLVGLTSWGSAQGCDRGKPTIFTRVSYYLKNISNGVVLASKAATVYNQAAPTNIERSSITGVARVGSTLTCDPGTWSENTTSVDAYWTSPSRISGERTASIVVKNEDAGQTFTCVALGKSRTAQLPVESKLTIPSAPVLDTQQSITGLGPSAPKIGTNITCSNATWRNNVETTLRPLWYVGDFYSRELLANSSTAVGEGTTLILTKEIILKALNKSILCASGVTGPGGTRFNIVSVRMPSITTPSPTVKMTGLVSNETPSPAQIVSCDVDQPEQYESIKYEWTLQTYSWSNSATAPIVGTAATYVFDQVNILTSARKYLQCKVTVTNLVGSGTSSITTYVKEPTAPDYFNVDIKGLTAQAPPANQLITCEARKLVGDEKATFTWGVGAYYFSSSIETILSTGPTLIFTGDIYDQVVGKSLICSVEIKNSIGKANATDGISIEVPTVQLFGKTGHYYQWVSEKVTWQQARANALSMNYLGLQGYLATPNTQAEFEFIHKKSGGRNIWLGVSDAQQEGCWRYSDGPEANTAFFAAPGVTNCPSIGGFTNWNSGEPNNANNAENWAMALTNGKWNDGPIDSLINSWSSWPNGYVVEFGGPVQPLAVTPGSAAAAPKMSASASTATGFTTASQTVTTTFTPDRFSAATFNTARIAIRLQGPAGFVASNYLPTLSNSSATRESSNPLGDYSWATNPGSTATINFSFVSLPQGRYTMTIVAQDTAGTTVTSNPMTFDVFVKVPTVTATTVTGKIDSVALSWMAPSQTAGITTYLVEYSKDGSAWTTFVRPDSTVTTTTVTGLEAGTSYTFRVTPSISGVVSATAATNSNSVSTNFQRVTNAVATPSSANFAHISLTWSAPTITTGLDNYRIEVSTDGVTWTVFERTASIATSATVTGLTFATSYRFRITPSFSAALDTNGQATTSVITTGSPSVTNVLASKVAGNNTSVSLTWTAPAMTTGLTTYRVEVSTDGTIWNEFARANSTVASATVTGLTAGTSYRFRITPVFNAITPDTRFSATSAAITTNVYNIAYSQNVLQDSPAYYFRMNGALANSGTTTLTLNSNLFLGTNTNIRSTGGVTDGFISSTGSSNPGFRFTQATDLFSDSIFTISGWVSTTSGSSTGNIFHIANGYDFLRLYLTPEGRISADAGVGGNTVRATVTGAPNANNLTDGRFHHFAWVSNGAVQSLYIDGALVGQTATFGLSFANGSEINFARTLAYPDAKVAGSDIASPVTYFGTYAALDEIALFNSALDATVISRHYAAGRELMP